MNGNKNFIKTKILFIFIGCLSCLGVAFFSQTLATYYTSYNFINEFVSPEQSQKSAVSIYQVGNIPREITSAGMFDCAFHIKNEGKVGEYIRVALPVGPEASSVEGISSMVGSWFVYISHVLYLVEWNSADGIFTTSNEGGSIINTNKWFQKDSWIYLKTPLSSEEDLQLTDKIGYPEEGASISETRNFKFIVESLPVDAEDDEFQSAWGVSKTELVNLGLDPGVTE